MGKELLTMFQNWLLSHMAVMTPGSSVSGSLDFGLDLLSGFMLFVSNKAEAIQPLSWERLAVDSVKSCQHLLESTCLESPALNSETQERKSSRSQSRATTELLGGHT